MVNTTDFQRDIKKDLYGEYKLYGPYKSVKDHIWRVCLKFTNKTYTTIMYARYLMELQLNKKLNSKEVVHHIDGNFDNNSLNNLIILSINEHAKLHGDKYNKLYVDCVCPYCKKEFRLTGEKLSSRIRNEHRINPPKHGPTCCPSCAGKISRFPAIKYPLTESLIREI